MYIAYIYDLNWDIIAQVEDILDLRILDKLNGVWTASFSLYHTNDYCTRTYIKKYRRVRLVMNKPWEEKTMFDGVIRWSGWDLEKTTIQLETFEHLLDRRELHLEYIYTNETLDNIINELINHINWIYDTWITVDCWITDVLTDKKYEIWTSILQVLQDLEKSWYEYIIENKVLKLKQTVWIDRSSWPDFIEYRYDINEPEDRSINTAWFTSDGKELATWVVGKSWTNYSIKEDATSKAEYWLIEETTVTSWDIENATDKYLQDHKQDIIEYNIWTTANDYFDANLWDLVKVYLFTGNDIMFFDWAMKVVEKEYIAWDLPDIKYKLSTTKVKTKDIIETIADMQNRIQWLELK
jgi:hypothetical protein